MRSVPVRRKRTGQPHGWNPARQGQVSHYYGAQHDYDYYPSGWTAPDGRYFEEGYYDENGQHYNNLIIDGATTMLKCAYCGNRMVYQWAQGSLPTCEKCGAQFQVDITDKAGAAPAARSFARNTSSGRSRGSILTKIMSLLMLCTFPALLLFFSMHRFTTGNRSVESTVSRPEKTSIYVEEIGRTCYLDGEDWYDSQTQCWFYYNDTEEPWQWQYWYEDISSDYGDYGWMEYDMGEEDWYVEAADGNWVHLPDSYDRSSLWHMKDEYVDPYR